MIDEMDILVKQNVKSKRKKIPETKHSGNLGKYEKTKPKSNRNRGKRRTFGQRPRKCFNKMIEFFLTCLRVSITVIKHRD